MSVDRVASEILLLALSESATAAPLSSRTALLAATRSSAFYSPLRVVFVGGFNRGKSSLINRILGRSILPTSVVSETPCVIRVTFSESEYVEISFQNGAVERFGNWNSELITRESLLERAAVKGAEVREIAIGLQIDFLRDIDLVDTPGLFEAFNRFDEQVATSLASSDCIVCVVSSTEPLSEEELVFLDSINRVPARPPAIVALTMSDRLSSTSDVEQLANNVLVRTRSVFPEAIVLALSSMQENSDGLTILKRALSQVLACRQSVNKLQHVRVLKTELQRFIKDLQGAEARVLTVTEASCQMHATSSGMDNPSKLREAIRANARECRLEATHWIRQFAKRIERELFPALARCEPSEVQKRLHFFLVETFGDAIKSCLDSHWPRLTAYSTQLAPLGDDRVAQIARQGSQHTFGVGLGTWVSADATGFKGQLTASIFDGLAPAWSQWLRASVSALQVVFGFRRPKSVDQIVRDEIVELQTSVGAINDFLVNTVEALYRSIEEELLKKHDASAAMLADLERIAAKEEQVKLKLAQASSTSLAESIDRGQVLSRQLDQIAEIALGELDKVVASVVAGTER